MEYRCLCCDAPAEEFGPYKPEDRLCERCATERDALSHIPREKTYIRVLKIVALLMALAANAWGIWFLFIR